MAVFQQQEEQSFNDERAVITSELHVIVDNLQLDAPQVEPPRRPFWQRPTVWQVPLFLIILAIVTLYNPRVDNCNGFKITYENQILCISDAADFFLFVEHFTCDFIEKGKSVADSLQIDAAAESKMAAYFEKHDFSLEKQPIEAEVLRGMRGVYDSTSFCKNLNRAYWNAGVRYVNLGKKDSACYYFGKVMTSTWRDSVFTNADFRAMIAQCNFIASAAKKDTATALNALNNRLLNINNSLQQRTNQRENTNRILNKVADKNAVPQQQTIPTDPSVKTGKVPPKALAKDAVLGFDLYDGNAISSLEEWQEAAKTYKFVYIKASEGGTVKFKRLDEFAEKAANVGILKGVYHFYRLANLDVNAQFQNFLQTITYSKQQFEMPPVVDIEPLPAERDGPRKEQLIAQRDTIIKNLKQFLSNLERQTRKRPVIYTTQKVWNDFLDNPIGFEKYPLWIGDYKAVNEPKLPTNWQNYTIWQYTESGTISGKNGYDINVFNGNYADFQQFIKSSNVGQSKF